MGRGSHLLRPRLPSKAYHTGAALCLRSSLRTGEPSATAAELAPAHRASASPKRRDISTRGAERVLLVGVNPTDSHLPLEHRKDPERASPPSRPCAAPGQSPASIAEQAWAARGRPGLFVLGRALRLDGALLFPALLG